MSNIVFVEVQNKKLQRYFIVAMTLGLLLRLGLMPFFSHVDLFSEYRRVFYALQTESYFPGVHRFVVFYIEIFSAWLATPFIHGAETIFYLPDPANSTASLTDYFFFVADPHVFRHLFLLKVPYLLFDMATALVVWRYFDRSELKKIGLLIWLFNPITLYAVYIFGRFESIGIFFLAMTALNVQRERFVTASIYFGVALHCREINILLAPFFLLSLIYFQHSGWKNVQIVGSAFIVVAVIYFLPDKLFNLFGGISLFADTGSITAMSHADQIYRLGYQWFYPIIFGFGALAIYLWETAEREPEERFVVGSAICFCLFMMFSGHSAHYSSWLILFPILSMSYGRKVILPFCVLFLVWFVYWVFRTDTGVFTPFLAMPLSTDFLLIDHFPKLYDRHVQSALFPLSKVVEILRTLFALSMAFFIWRLVQRP